MTDHPSKETEKKVANAVIPLPLRQSFQGFGHYVHRSMYEIMSRCELTLLAFVDISSLLVISFILKAHRLEKEVI